MQRGAAGRAAGQDEGAQLGQFRFGGVDPLLHDACVIERELRQRRATPLGRAGRGEVRADREEIGLDPGDHLRDRRVADRRERPAEHGVQLVDLAVGVHARVGFRHARVVEERCLAGVAGLCVDLHVSNREL